MVHWIHGYVFDVAIRKKTDNDYNLIKIKNYKESIKCFEEVLRIDPNDLLALNNKVISYLKSGQYKEADKIFRKEYQSDKDEGKFNYNQACITCLRKETQKALNFLKYRSIVMKNIK